MSRWCWCRRAESAPSPFGGGAADEVEAFGGSTFGVFADDESLAAFGPNPLDPACRMPSAQAGRAQGRRVAGDLADFLGALNQLSSVGFSSSSSRWRPARWPTSMTSAARWNSRLRQRCAAPRSAGQADRPQGCDAPARPARCRWCGSSPRSCRAWAPTSCSSGRFDAVSGRAARRCLICEASAGAAWCRTARWCCATSGSAILSSRAARPRSARRGRRLAAERLTAMVRSALTAAIGAIGSGSRMPPSASRRPSSTCGVITPGIAIDARIAASTRTALQPHRLAREQVGGDGGVRDRQLLDRHLAENVADRVQDLLRPQHPGRGDRRVQQPQHRALRQRLGPVRRIRRACPRPAARRRARPSTTRRSRRSS